MGIVSPYPNGGNHDRNTRRSNSDNRRFVRCFVVHLTMTKAILLIAFASGCIFTASVILLVIAVINLVN